jgi:hypothetical protein
MNPDQISGRQAAAAWRALRPEQRAAAWAAAKAGAAPESTELAVVMAGYGNRWYQRLRWGAIAVPFALIVLACLGGVAAAAADVDIPALALQIAVYALLGGPVLTMLLLRQRFRRLAAAGALGLEAAHAGALPAPALTGAPGFVPESEYTVPAGVPFQPGVPATAVVGPDGVTELPTRRAPVVLLLLFLGGLVVCVSGAAITAAVPGSSGGGSRTSWLPMLFPLVIVLPSFVIVFAATWRGLRSKVLLRFTRSGWELPGSGLRGDWSDVTGVEVRAFTAGGGGLASTRQASVIRVVVLRVANPEHYLAQVGPVTRWLLRRGTRKYSSPVTIAVGQRFPISLEQLLATLAHYTQAPVSWTTR